MSELVLHPDGTTEPLNLPRKGELPRLLEILRIFPPLNPLVFELPTGYVVIGTPYHRGLLLEYNSRASALVKDCPNAVSLHGPAIIAPREVFADSILDSDAKRMSISAPKEQGPATNTCAPDVNAAGKCPHATTSGDPKCFVYGVIDGASGEPTLIFIPEPEAFRLAAIYRALEAETWGDFYDLMPEVSLGPIKQNLLDYGDLPSRTDKFDSTKIPGLCDGLWPTWAEQEMMNWLPPEIWTRYGGQVASMHDGSFLTIDPVHTADVVEELQQAGYACRRDDALVRKACDC
jgi:hypothetical protein